LQKQSRKHPFVSSTKVSAQPLPLMIRSDVEVQNVEVQNVEVQNVEVQSVEIQKIEVQNVEVQNVDKITENVEFI
jgi:hypothetical protein